MPSPLPRLSFSFTFGAFPLCSFASCLCLWYRVWGGGSWSPPFSGSSCHPPSTPVMSGPTVNQMPPEHTKDVRRVGLAAPGDGVQWARGRERPSLEPRAPVSSWAAGRTLGHGRPSWTLLCHLVAVICNCGRPRTARGADPVGRFQVCEADQGSPAYPSLGSIARTPPAVDRGCVALLWPGWSPLPLDGGQGLSCPRG